MTHLRLYSKLDALIEESLAVSISLNTDPFSTEATLLSSISVPLRPVFGDAMSVVASPVQCPGQSDLDSPIAQLHEHS